MVYGAAYWNASADEIDSQGQPNIHIPKGFHDSKQLSDETRRRLYQQLLDHDDIGFLSRGPFRQARFPETCCGGNPTISIK
jgi:ribonuclease HII